MANSKALAQKIYHVTLPPKGFPPPEVVQRTYDEVDLNRAVQSYRFFYPNVSFAAVFNGVQSVGGVPNRKFGIVEASPAQNVFTANSDTPYATALLDLREGPVVVQLPAGPFIGVANDLNQRWVADMGLPGPDEGRGGKYVLLPPGFQGKVPEGYRPGYSTTYRVVLAIRVIPVDGNLRRALEQIPQIKIAPLNKPEGWVEPEWQNASDLPQDSTPVSYETTLKFWEILHGIIDSEPSFEPYRNYYGELAALGIAKGKPFAPDHRTRKILEDAAKIANRQMRVQAFADRRPDRVVWKNRYWEWLTLTPENGFFDREGYSDLEAREKWFFQAIVESPAMFRRKEGLGSLYWLSARDRNGEYLDGGSVYRLVIPQPVPAKLFWSLTVYDSETRSEIRTDQNKAALRSLFELKSKAGARSVALYFGPEAPVGHEEEWIKTLPGQGWFAYLRIYGPEGPCFAGTWKPGDFEPL